MSVSLPVRLLFYLKIFTFTFELLSPLVAMTADWEIDISSGVLEEVEATLPPVTNPAPSTSSSAPVVKETLYSVSRPPPKAPPLPVLRFPKVSRGWG